MITVTVQRTIGAPREKVFAALTDHANYARFPGIKASKLTKAGRKERNGVGAERFVDAGLLRVHEKITAYDAPASFSYQIFQSFPPLLHQGGTITFIETADGSTNVEWSSTLTLPLPLIGDFFAKLLLKSKIEQAFGAILKSVEQELTTQ